jgi:hypothetical protein
VAADRKGGRPPTQALPHQARRLFGSYSTEPGVNFLFWRVFCPRTSIHLLENATGDLRKPVE